MSYFHGFSVIDSPLNIEPNRFKKVVLKQGEKAKLKLNNEITFEDFVQEQIDGNINFMAGPSPKFIENETSMPGRSYDVIVQEESQVDEG